MTDRPVRRRWWLDLPYVLFAVAVPVNLLTRSDQSVRPVVLAVIFPTVELIGVGFGLRASFHPRLNAAERRPWRYLTAWYVVQVFYGAMIAATPHQEAFAYAGRRIGPVEAAALVSRLVEVPVLFGGLLSFAGEPLSRWGRRRLATDVATVIGAAIMVLWYFLVGPALFETQVAVSGTLRVGVIGFPVCDLVLLVAVLTVLMRGVDPGARRPVMLLTAGLVIGLASDCYLTYLAALAPDRAFGLSEDLFAMAGLMLFGAATIERCRSAGQRRRAQQNTVASRPSTFLPYLALVGGYVLLFTVAVRHGAYPWPGLVLGAVVMTTAVAGRQVVSLRENHLLATTDSLTGLANRLLLHERMARALARSRRSGAPMALLMIDLDGFKQVNDTYGHEAGDAVLVEFAGILKRHVRSTDTPARLGGDEFAVLLDGITDAQDAVEVAKRLLGEVRSAPGVDGNPDLRVGASIGIAVGDPRSRAGLVDPHKQVRQADQAMYVAKKAKTTGWCIYTRELDQAVEQAGHEISA